MATKLLLLNTILLATKLLLLKTYIFGNETFVAKNIFFWKRNFCYEKYIFLATRSYRCKTFSNGTYHNEAVLLWKIDFRGQRYFSQRNILLPKNDFRVVIIKKMLIKLINLGGIIRMTCMSLRGRRMTDHCEKVEVIYKMSCVKYVFREEF